MTDREYSLETTVQRNPEILSREIEGEAVLLDPEEGTYFALNDTGTVIWNLIEEPVQLAEVKQQLLAAYEVDEEQLWSEIQQLLADLDGKGLLRIS